MGDEMDVSHHMSHLSNLSSANNFVDLEIKWFETDCVYEIQKILPLKNESDVGVYLCKVTCEDRIKEINISLKEAPGTEQASTLKLNDKKLTDNDRINQTCSALLEVFSNLQKVLQTDRQSDEAAKHLDKQQQGCPENKDCDKKDNNASVHQTRKKVEHKEIKPKEKDSRQENKQLDSTKQSGNTAIETSPSQPFENLVNKELDGAVFSAPEKSKGSQTDRQGDDNQNEPAENMNNRQPGPPEKSKWPQTDRQDDDNPNEAGGNPDNRQPGPPEKSEVLPTDIQDDVDQNKAGGNLDNQDPGSPGPGFSKDQEKIQIPLESHTQVVCLQDEEESQESQIKKLKKEKKGGTVFSILAGKINDIHNKFVVHLQDRIEDLTEAQKVEDSDVVLIFCPIVSRAGTDIDAALAKIDYVPASKLTVLVVLHHTFDPEKTVSDSSKSVNKENLLTVDCLFYEDTGLLDCQRNSDALDKSVNWLIAQGHTVGSSFQHKSDSSSGFLSSAWFKKKMSSFSK